MTECRSPYIPPDAQRFAIRGQIWEARDPGLQDALARIHETAERPRCLCVPRGIEMYVAHHHGKYWVKRMPESGKEHHPSCPSYEPEAAMSGLGDLIGEAVLETLPGLVELRVDFSWSRVHGRSVARGEVSDAPEITVPRRRMSLRAVLHFLFERAGFNRWTPAMNGRRNQGVLQKYLLEAARDIEVKGRPLAERLYVPEPFNEPAKAEIARRRRDKLAVLQPRDGNLPMALVIGEFKGYERADQGCRVWIRHMPDVPLLMDTRSWDRLARTYAALLEARDADSGQCVRLILAALIHARREFTYAIDTATVMLVSEQWIPVEGVHELPLIGALVEGNRRFVKPLRYDARSAAPFPNVLLLDGGGAPICLHMSSEFLHPRDRSLKEKAMHAAGPGAWCWHAGNPMPVLPPSCNGPRRP